MGIMSRENSRGGFPLPSSRFLLSSVLLVDSSIIDTSMYQVLDLYSKVAAVAGGLHFLYSAADRNLRRLTAAAAARGSTAVAVAVTQEPC